MVRGECKRGLTAPLTHSTEKTLAKENSSRYCQGARKWDPTQKGDRTSDLSPLSAKAPLPAAQHLKKDAVAAHKHSAHFFFFLPASFLAGAAATATATVGFLFSGMGRRSPSLVRR